MDVRTQVRGVRMRRLLMHLQLRLPGQADAGTGEPAAERGASRGQVLIMFAFFLTAMMGMMGLAVDLGFAFAQRRTIQNAADLSATAGARVVARYRSDNVISALPDVQAIVDDNHIPNTTTVLEECTYLDQFGQDVGDCVINVPANATGVRVQVSETHRTFFISAVPGAPVYVTTRTSASAQLERFDLAGMDAPFILCGEDTKLEDGSEMDVLLNEYVVNPDAIGETFRLTGPSRNDIARCGAGTGGTGNGSTSYGGRWRGLADKTANSGKRIVLETESTSAWWNPKIGSPSTNVNTITNNVKGISGCEELESSPFDCIMLVPVATDYDITTRRFKVTKVMGFAVTQDDSDPNTFWGTLLDDYLVFGASVPLSIDRAPWCRDCGSVMVVRLAS